MTPTDRLCNKTQDRNPLAKAETWHRLRNQVEDRPSHRAKVQWKTIQAIEQRSKEEIRFERAANRH
jgi:hypothetical protein